MTVKYTEIRFDFSKLKKSLDTNYEKRARVKEKKESILKAKEEKRNSWKLYSSKAWEITNSLDLSELPYFEKRGKCCGSYQLDHKLSIYKGWKNNTPIEIIAGMDNLHFIPEEENMRKGQRNWDEYLNSKA